MPFLAGNSVEEDSYLQNRLKWAMSAPVPASVRVDLAQDDNLDDDAFEEAVSVLGGSQAGSYGLGLSEVFSEFLSRSPRTVPVRDITALQQNLIRQGYMRPGTQATGKWDSTFAAAMRRADRDAANELRSGKNYVSAPTATVLRYLGETLPSAVFQGIVGTAKGMVQQAPETLERGGFVGGALTAGAIGAAVGSVLPGVGTAAVGGIAALAGGIAGFLSDFFQEDEDEEQQGLGARAWDALTPLDEYKGGREGAQRLFEDLGFIVSAASLVTAGGAAARLTTQGVQAAAAGGLRTSLTSFNPAARAGVLARLGAGATKPLSSNAASWWIKSSQYVRTNPLLHTVRGPYGQLTQASLVGRLAGGVGSGEADTAIEKGIKSTARLGAGKHLPVSIPFFAPDGEVSDLIDVVASMAIWPEKLLSNPTNVGKAGKALNLDASNLNLDPYISVAQHSPGGKTLSLSDSRQAALEMLGKTPEERAAANAFYRWNYGVNQKASEWVSSKVNKLDDPWKQEELWTKAKGRLVRKATREAAEGDFTTAKEILSRSYEQPTHFSAYIRGIEGVGSDLEKGSAYREAAFLLQDANAKGLIQSTSKRAPKFSDFDVAVARAKATEFEKEAKQLARAADKQPGLSTAERITNKTEADRLTQEAKRLRTEAERAVKKAQAANKKTKTATPEPLPGVVPARKYAPDAGDPGYLTRNEAEGLANRYDEIADNVRATWQNHLDSANLGADRWRETEKVYFSALNEMDNFVSDLQFRQVVEPGTEILGTVRVPDPPKDISAKLRKIARLRGSEVDVPADVAAKLDELGYVAINTGQDVLHLSDVPKVLELHGVGDYSTKERFYEGLKSMGLGKRIDPDKGVSEIRYANTRAELQHVLASEGIRLTGDSAARTLQKTLDSKLTEKPGRAFVGPFVVDEAKSGIGKFQLPRQDLRQIDLDTMVDSLGLEQLVKPGQDPYEVATKLRDAIHRGAAFGGELSIRHPIEMARQVGNALRIDGLPGFAAFMRQAHVPDAVMPAKWKKGHYGFLPEKAWNATLALRYSLSPMFDMSRYVEQTGMAKLRGEGAIPLMLRPQKAIAKRTFNHSPYGDGMPVTGDEAWGHAKRLYDEVIAERKVMGPIDDLQRRFEAVGIMGFSPKQFEASQAWFLYQAKAADLGADVSKWDPKEIAALKDKVLTIGRYGSGRSPLEKTLHMVFFPISFQKKMYKGLVDYVASAPVRALLIHEGVRRYEELNESGKLQEFTEKWAPILQPLSQLNNLLYGASPGRFFLEGLGDKEKPKMAKALEAVTAAFVPGGAHAPLHQAVATLFTPNALDADGVDKLIKAWDRVAPAFGDVFGPYGIAKGVKDQATALTEGGAPYWQYRKYVEGRQDAKAEWAPLATALGYASVDSFLRSEQGIAFADQVEAKNQELARQYPVGEREASSFSTDVERNKLELVDLGEKPDRSEAEEAVLEIAERVEMARSTAQFLGVTVDEAVAMFARGIRAVALEHVEDPQFVRLWERHFSDEFGPVRQISSEPQGALGRALSPSAS
jgi:hypothetical protein